MEGAADMTPTGRERSGRDFGGRYARQEAIAVIGRDGQAKLASARVVIVGCGALGCVSANLLVRAGVGRATIVDRDVVEWTNLQRQVLFTERHACEGRAKADAAAEVLRGVNSGVRIDAVVEELNHRNAERIVLGRSDEGADPASVIVDATDNLRTRYILNDVAVKHGLTLVYGGAIETRGMTMTVRGGESACLRCVFPEVPARGNGGDSCDVSGVIAAAAGLIGSVQSAEAMRAIVGAGEGSAGEARTPAARAEKTGARGEGRGMQGIGGVLREWDVWNGRYREVYAERDAECPCCAEKRFEFLEGKFAERVTVVCAGGTGVDGCVRTDVVQVAPERGDEGSAERARGGAGALDLAHLRAALSRVGEVTGNELAVRVRLGADGGEKPAGVREITVFADGRALIRGAGGPERAMALYDRLVGR